MTDTSKAGTLNDIIRSLVSLFDKAAYFLLGMMYQIFFNVASADLFNNATILNFYKRIQLIIGIFMIFVLAVTIIKGIMNPDTITDSKSGVSSLITRVMMALVLLTVLVPINIPAAKTEYEIQLNNNGLLFGTLYSLQNRILKNNTLGRLVLGTDELAATSDDNSSALTGANKQEESLKKSANVFTSTILRGFIRINLIPGTDDDTVRANRICPDMDQDALDIYTNINSEPSEIIELINESCSVDTGSSWYNDLPKGSRHRKMYAFAMNLPFVSAIVGFIFVFVLLDFTIQIAIRAIKLAILRLIAPIPIISYMNPLGSKDNAFNSWVKSLTSTYLDLFIRLIIIYFVIYLIQDMMVNGIVMNTGSGLVGILSAILIWIGLFIFAQQAPKFIKQILGIKDDGDTKLFGGLGKLAGVGAAAAGGIGAFNAARMASRMADETNHGEASANRLWNRGKHLLAGITGGVMGVGTGMKTALSSKDHALKNTFDSIQKRNATAISRGSAGSTLFGRMGTNIGRSFVGESAYERESRELNKFKGIATTGEDLQDYIKSKGISKNGNRAFNVSFSSGGRNYSIANATYDDWSSAWNAAKQSGARSFVFNDQTFGTTSSMAKDFDDALVAEAGKQWASTNVGRDDGLDQKLASFREAGGESELSNPNDIYDSEALKKAYKKAKGNATRIENNKKYQKHKADHGATGGSK